MADDRNLRGAVGQALGAFAERVIDAAPGAGDDLTALEDLAVEHGLDRDSIPRKFARMMVPRAFRASPKPEHEERQQRASQWSSWHVPDDAISKLQEPDRMRETEAMQGARFILRAQRDGKCWGLLAGGMGSGKSFAAGWWLTEVRSSRGTSPRRFIASSKIHALPRGTKYAEEQIEALCQANALVIDDVGVLDGDGQVMGETMRRILASRYDSRLPTMLTTNMRPRDQWLPYLGDPRLVDRWNEIGVSRGTREASMRGRGQ